MTGAPSWEKLDQQAALFAANTTCRAREENASATCATRTELFSHGSTFVTGGTCASHANVAHTYVCALPLLCRRCSVVEHADSECLGAQLAQCRMPAPSRQIVTARRW